MDADEGRRESHLPPAQEGEDGGEEVVIDLPALRDGLRSRGWSVRGCVVPGETGQSANLLSPTGIRATIVVVRPDTVIGRVVGETRRFLPGTDEPGIIRGLEEMTNLAHIREAARPTFQRLLEAGPQNERAGGGFCKLVRVAHTLTDSERDALLAMANDPRFRVRAVSAAITEVTGELVSSSVIHRHRSKNCACETHRRRTEREQRALLRALATS